MIQRLKLSLTQSFLFYLLQNQNRTVRIKIQPHNPNGFES